MNKRAVSGPHMGTVHRRLNEKKKSMHTTENIRYFIYYADIIIATGENMKMSSCLIISQIDKTTRCIMTNTSHDFYTVIWHHLSSKTLQKHEFSSPTIKKVRIFECDIKKKIETGFKQNLSQTFYFLNWFERSLEQNFLLSNTNLFSNILIRVSTRIKP